MEINLAQLDGVYIIDPRNFEDTRGQFIKVFNKEIFEKIGLITSFQESYYSTSKKNVIRGMHFQIPPMDHAKLIYVTKGSITDVVLDIRKGSPTYGQYQSINLSDKNKKAIYIPSGFAHGFLSLEDDSCVVYMQTSVYSKVHDGGIKFDSFGMDWKISDPIVSDRDKNFDSLPDFKSSFVYRK